LLALALLAVVIGLLTVNYGHRSPGTGSPPAAVPAAPATTAPPTVIPFPPPVLSSPPAAPGTAPPAAAGDASAPVGGESSASKGEVRVYNNSTIHGLAARAARDLAAAGWTVVEVGNYPWGTIPTTTVYYQEGTPEQAAAEEIGAQFGMRVEPRFAGIARAKPGLIIIVTRDYLGRQDGQGR
jgi:hypothetical protein